MERAPLHHQLSCCRRGRSRRRGRAGSTPWRLSGWKPRLRSWRRSPRREPSAAGGNAPRIRARSAPPACGAMTSTWLRRPTPPASLGRRDVGHEQALERSRVQRVRRRQRHADELQTMARPARAPTKRAPPGRRPSCAAVACVRSAAPDGLRSVPSGVAARVSEVTKLRNGASTKGSMPKQVGPRSVSRSTARSAAQRRAPEPHVDLFRAPTIRGSRPVRLLVQAVKRGARSRWRDRPRRRRRHRARCQDRQPERPGVREEMADTAARQIGVIARASFDQSSVGEGEHAIGQRRDRPRRCDWRRSRSCPRAAPDRPAGRGPGARLGVEVAAGARRRTSAGSWSTRAGDRRALLLAADSRSGKLAAGRRSPPRRAGRGRAPDRLRRRPRSVAAAAEGSPPPSASESG